MTHETSFVVFDHLRSISYYCRFNIALFTMILCYFAMARRDKFRTMCRLFFPKSFSGFFLTHSAIFQTKWPSLNQSVRLAFVMVERLGQFSSTFCIIFQMTLILQDRNYSLLGANNVLMDTNSCLIGTKLNCLSRHKQLAYPKICRTGPWTLGLPPPPPPKKISLDPGINPPPKKLPPPPPPPFKTL